MPKPPVPAFLSEMADALKGGYFVRAQFAAYKGVDQTLKKIILRQVLVKQKPHLSFTYQHKTRDITKNLPIDAGLDVLGDALGHEFGAATLFTTQFDLQYPSMRKHKATYHQVPPMDHDRQKKRSIAAGGQAWLQALGIAGADGKILSASQDKFRQINRYIELVAPLFANLENPRVADMGSGKGYLTFALYDYLKAQGKNARVTGVEDRPALVELCNDVAFASDFSGLDFVQGRIADFNAEGTDVLIALHACDTATDDAIAAGLRAHAQAIIVAPCCHKQVRRNMEKAKKPEDLAFMLRHGIFMERQAEMVTDALRALYLEAHGYAVKVFEFISDAHTPKNIMIVATRGTGLPVKTESRKKIDDVKSAFGIFSHPLDGTF